MSLVLPLDAWPETDKAMWYTLCQRTGPLDDGGGLDHLREASKETLRLHYGRWLRWVLNSEARMIEMQPVERLTIARLQDWLEDLSHTSKMSQWSFVGNTVRVLQASAPDHDWRIYKRLVKHLRWQAGQGDRSRKEGRVCDSEMLLKIGIRIATKDADAASTPLQQLQRQRDGAMIAFLSLLPIRRRAFAGLRIGTSIFFSDAVIRVALPEDLTKTGVPWEADVPANIEPLIRRYFLDVRPALLARGRQCHDVFWVGDKGAPYQLNHLGHRIGNITEQALGVRITPHLFRDAAATTLSRCSPDAARLIPPVLSHTSNLTAQRHYIHAGTIEAGRGLSDIISSLKKGRGGGSAH